MLGYLIERLRRCHELDGMILATSDDSSDDSLETFARSVSLQCYRGPLDDVATRMLRAAELSMATAVVRISGDSPLIDSSLVDRLVSIFRAEDGVDLVTNVQKRTFPKGQSVEVISLKTLRHLVNEGLSAHEQEHVTTKLYNHPERFKIINIEHNESIGDMQLSVDTEKDMIFFESILENLGKPHWQHSLNAVVDAARRIGRVSA